MTPHFAAYANDEQTRLREDIKKGEVRSLRAIEGLIVPPMVKRGAKYIGAEYNPDSKRYRLKFMRQVSVIWIDVDGRSGEIIAQAGN